MNFERDYGSTIIEAMIAVAILGSAMVVIMPSYISSVNAAQVQKQYARALVLLENEYASRIHQGFVVNDLNQRRRQTFDEMIYEIHSTTRQIPDRGIDLLTINVQWPADGRRVRNIEVATYLFDISKEEDHNGAPE